MVYSSPYVVLAGPSRTRRAIVYLSLPDDARPELSVLYSLALRAMNLVRRAWIIQRQNFLVLAARVGHNNGFNVPEVRFKEYIPSDLVT